MYFHFYVKNILLLLSMDEVEVRRLAANQEEWKTRVVETGTQLPVLVNEYYKKLR